MFDKPTGNLLRIAAPPGASKVEFVRNRLVSALFNSAQATLISLDPEIDSYRHKVLEMGGWTALPDHGTCLIGGPNLRYLGWAALGDGSAGAWPSLIDSLEQSGLTHTCHRTGRRGLLIIDGCQWLTRQPIASVADRVRRHALNWIDRGGDLIAIGRDADCTEFLDGIPVVQMRSKYGDDWTERDQAWLVSSAWRESSLGPRARSAL